MARCSILYLAVGAALMASAGCMKIKIDPMEDGSFHSTTEHDARPIIYYVNRDQNSDLASNIETQLRRDNLMDANFHVERWRALDGNDVDSFSSEYGRLFNRSDFLDLTWANDIKSKCLTHYLLWRRIAQDDKAFTIVLEDDLVLRSNFAQGLVDLITEVPYTTKPVFVAWIGLGMKDSGLFETWPEAGSDMPFPIEGPYDPNTFSRRYPNDLPDSLRKCRKNVNPCARAYIVTSRGARALVNHVDENGFSRAHDAVMNDFLMKVDRHYIASKILATPPPGGIASIECATAESINTEDRDVSFALLLTTYNASPERDRMINDVVEYYNAEGHIAPHRLFLVDSANRGVSSDKIRIENQVIFDQDVVCSKFSFEGEQVMARMELCSLLHALDHLDFGEGVSHVVKLTGKYKLPELHLLRPQQMHELWVQHVYDHPPGSQNTEIFGVSLRVARHIIADLGMQHSNFDVNLGLHDTLERRLGWGGKKLVLTGEVSACRLPRLSNVANYPRSHGTVLPYL